ncbi:hypothetical protein I6E52_09820 [Salinibacterium sp. NG253]|uniref:GNAT family N-acetyltransferase n=1 Tax=Salinibacterium sp. NG253 TaxID=2792039 RepID=UPI0018CE294D|nr:GNAT family N-acetyltransferase [Salinibacterium sp. NG253]MBH0117141.1 hypothetical protein [Salinibacterium sp. NG253]
MIDVRIWDPQGNAATGEFEQIVTLHRKSKATLGQLPFAAFRQAGEQGHLLMGFVNGKLEGYVLYSTPRHHTLKLVHVCVAVGARGTGLAGAMVEAAIRHNPGRSTITAHCRSDYGLDGFWRSLDMTPEAERAGRAKAGSTLIVWTRRIGPRDLLEEALYGSARPLAVLDSNVLIDLYSSEAIDRHDRHESSGLSEDWIVDLLELTYSPEAYVDLKAFADAGERTRMQRRLGSLVALRRVDGMKALVEQLISKMPSAMVLKDRSLSSDAIHLADAILAGADFFVTRDNNLIEATSEWIAREYDLEVLRPVALIQQMMPEAALSRFRSDLLESVGLAWSTVSTVSAALEQAFLDHRSQEKGAFFKKELQAVLASPNSARLSVLTDKRGRQLALLGTRVQGELLTVPILRVARGTLGSTIAFQLVRYLRDIALSLGAAAVSVVEDRLDPVVANALRADGFVGHPMVVTVARHPPEGLKRLASAIDVAAYERQNWPQILLDSGLPLWVVPIQPTYARGLLGFNDTLISARDKPALGLSREFAYFSSPKIKAWDVPARVLWYVTKDTNAKEPTAVRALVAHSRVTDSVVMEVGAAMSQYRSFGTLREREIRDRSRDGRVRVLRFEDTQLLDEPIARRNLGPIFDRFAIKTPIQSARMVPSHLFDVVVRDQPGFEGR